MLGFQFYPTPLSLVQKMISYVDWKNVSYMLEPSAGKGDIVKGVRAFAKGRGYRFSIDTVEFDPNLQGILKAQGEVVVGTDFLEFKPTTSYDLFMMNPPFAYGLQHLEKAISLLRVTGGQCVCLLNAATFQDGGKTLRAKETYQYLISLDAKMQVIKGAFLDAERKTAVDTLLVYFKIEKEFFDPFKSIPECMEYVEKPQYNKQELALNDILQMLVLQYNRETAVVRKLIESYQSAQKYMTVGSNLITLNVADFDNESCGMYNTYLQNLRMLYWQKLFNTDALAGLLTGEVRERLQLVLKSYAKYDFTLSNIKQIQINLNNNLQESTEASALKMYDKLTFAYSLSKETNVHYFNGWHTNDAFMLKNRVIIPIYGLYESKWNSWDIYKATNVLAELERILEYFNPTKTVYRSVRTINNNVKGSVDWSAETVRYHYFTVSYKKKGTVHVTFNSEELLKKYNIFACQKHGWLPDSYGKVRYDTMTTEEKSVIDSFEGAESYKRVCQHPGFYLNTTQNFVAIGVNK